MTLVIVETKRREVTVMTIRMIFSVLTVMTVVIVENKLKVAKVMTVVTKVLNNNHSSKKI